MSEYQMMINTLDNSITQHPEKSKGCQVSASPVRQNKICSRSNPAKVEQTEKLSENQEKERVTRGGRSDQWKKQNNSREGPPKLRKRETEVTEILVLTVTPE